MLCSLCIGLFVMYTSSVFVGCPVVAFPIFLIYGFYLPIKKKKIIGLYFTLLSRALKGGCH